MNSCASAATIEDNSIGYVCSDTFDEIAIGRVGYHLSSVVYIISGGKGTDYCHQS